MPVAIDHLPEIDPETLEEQRALPVAMFGGNPGIRIPENPFGPRPYVEPIRGTGIPASELLIRDRR